MQTPSDPSIRGTNDDATEGKQSAVQLGYYEDPYLALFLKRPTVTRRSNIMNRGYYARVAMFMDVVEAFLAAGGRQIVSLGAGFDTTFFKLKAQGRAPERYVEVDFPEIVAAKASYLRRRKPLNALLGDVTTLNEKKVDATEYHLAGADLRQADALRTLLTTVADPSLPTLFLAECVLIYLKPEESVEVIRMIPEVFARCAFAMYEQIRPHDGFGETMVHNLKARGIPLLSLHKYPELKDQEERFTSSGWTTCRAVDMNEVYDSLLDREEVARVEKIEMFDEMEEWRLIQGHYTFVLAEKGLPAVHPMLAVER